MSDFTLVHKLKSLQATSYFRESKHYVSFELPPYFNFDEILLSASAILNQKTLADVCTKKTDGKPSYPSDFQGVNYIILSNKDGSFAWRPLQLIHPVLYMDLVNLMTEKKAWKAIGDFFDRREKSFVECISLSLKSNIEESNRAVTVSNWWDKIEQESLRRSLDYRFMFQTDISNCYPSIYTHSLEWALAEGGRLEVKEKRAKGKNTKNIGSEIDIKLQQMNQKQTIGIPQGSALMDFIAEIVLGGTDMELSERIKSEVKKGAVFKILRYRDDYRIFSNEYQVGHQIMKILNDVLYSWNMKMNASKTSETSDVVTASIKAEKVEEIYVAPVRLTFQKAAMRTYTLSKKHPNAGLIAKNLTEYYDRLITYQEKLKKDGIEHEFDYEVVLTIITMIGFYSPRYMPQVAAIVTKIIDISDKGLNRKKIISRIINKFGDVPNTEFIDVWLQRITDKSDISSFEFGSEITKVALSRKNNEALWNSDWLNVEDRKTINTVKLSDLSDRIELGTFSPIVEREEFELYRVDYDR